MSACSMAGCFFTGEAAPSVMKLAASVPASSHSVARNRESVFAASGARVGIQRIFLSADRKGQRAIRA